MKLWGFLLAISLAVSIIPAVINADEPAWWDVATPSPLRPHAIGGPSRGCVAGTVALPLSGPGFQVMRPSRQRYYGHPHTIAFIQSFAAAMVERGWPGLLVGDISQARGGPMKTGHRSHQNGLDVDIWFRPAPPDLSPEDRETLSALSLVASNGLELDTQNWTHDHILQLRTAASFAEVQRVFVHPVIKRTACVRATGDRTWLNKIRPWWGHNYHFHVRLRCPEEDRHCVDQAPAPPGDGCGPELSWWFSPEAAQKRTAKTRRPPARTLTLADLPATCRSVLLAPHQAKEVP